MPYPLGDWRVERRYAMEIELERRQDPASSSLESTPPDTETQSSTAETSATTPTSTEAPTSTTPTSTSSAPTSTSPPTSPSQSATLPIVSDTSSIPTPTDPGQSSSVASQSSASTASTRSVVNSLSSAGSSPVITQVITSVIVTNSAGQSVVTVSYTSNYAVPTAAPSTKSTQNVGAIVGGAVGGVGGLLILALLLWFIRRKTKRDKFEENMFEPDRNIDRPIDLVEGDDVNDPEAIARPYQLPPSPTRPEMGMAANARPLSMQSALTQGRPLSSEHYDPLTMSRPTSGGSYYAPPNAGMGMPIPMPLSRDHLAHMNSRANSTLDHSQPTSEAISDGGSSSARALKDREARRLHVANDDGGVLVHSDGGRVNDPDDEEPPREIPPTYESIGGPSGAR